MNNSLKCKKLSKKKCNILLFYSIRVAGHLLEPYLSHFFTFFFNLGVFPDILKVAALTPIHKTENTTKLQIIVRFHYYLAFLKFLKN